MAFHLAQLNIGRILFPMDTPEMSGFKDNLDRINALADSSEGFVWRLVGDGEGSNDATSLRPFDDDSTLLINMSVWTDLEGLKNYVYKSVHTDFLKRRAEWFEKMRDVIVVLWWIPEGHIPTVQEAKERLERLRKNGSNEFAFSFREAFPAPSEPRV
jgi:Domain of unknown function (DUF3291)